MDRETWSDLAVLASIVEAGGFSRAAPVLGVSPSALSHRIKALEGRLGVRLLNRTTRSVAPTEAGERLLSRLRPAMAEIDSAVAELDHDRGGLRGGCGSPRIAPRLSSWCSPCSGGLRWTIRRSWSSW